MVKYGKMGTQNNFLIFHIKQAPIFNAVLTPIRIMLANGLTNEIRRQFSIIALDILSIR